MQDKEVLILGHGSIGRAVEARLRPFGARITGVARSARPGVRALSGRCLLALSQMHLYTAMTHIRSVRSRGSDAENIRSP